MSELSYQFDYSATSRGSCKGCSGGMGQGELKIGKEVKSRFHDGIEVKWYHYNCMSGNSHFQNTKLSTMKGWRRLRWEDILLIKETVEDDCPIDASKEEELKELNEKFWEVRDQLEDVQNKILKQILEENGKTFDSKVSSSVILDAAADLFAFGRLQCCPQCKQDALINHHLHITCNGNLTEYEKCGHKIEDFSSVKRYAFVLSDKLKIADKKGVLKGWEFDENFPKEKWTKKVGEGAENAEEEVEEKMEEDNTPEDEITDNLVLRGMKIIVCGTAKNLDGTIAEYNQMIKEYGGEIAKSTTEATVCVSTDEDMSQAKTVKIKDAKEMLTCLKIDWLVTLIDKPEGFMKLRTKEGAEEYLCEGCSWNSEIVYKKYHKTTEVQIEKETFKPIDGCDLLQLHPENDLGNGWKVLLENDPIYGWTAYNVKMTKVDADSGKNSVYQIQIAHNKPKTKYHMIMEWGRVGERVHNTSRSGPIEELKEEFSKKFKDCTGNEWEQRLSFKKVPGRYFMQKLDDGKDDSTAKKELTEEAKKQREEKQALLKEKAKESYLDERVRELIEMIFDTDMMKQTLQKAGLNLEQMPLGKIKISQMKEAMKVLSKLSDLFSENCELGDAEKHKKIKAYSNQYYELVPHIMHGKVELIDDDEKVKKELRLVETMCDVGAAMELMEEDADLDLDAMTKIYANYKKLNTEITALDKESERFKLLEEFFTNNQEKGHYRGKVNVRDIYEIKRDGERKRYEPNENDENRQLLYHGSRLTNFVGILSTGLRIAPPEAPCNGYRFGKGLYFANCASKSVSYCTYNHLNRGCMLLCEVALGKQWETLRDKYMEKPQKGFDSTYALGQVEPDQKDEENIVVLEDGVKVNKGKIVTIPGREHSWCSHSELIVYDVARVNIRYLVIFELP